MRDITGAFREFARLDLMRMSQGLSVAEHERWAKMRALLDDELGGSDDSYGPTQRRSAKRVQTRLNCAYSSGSDRRDAVVTDLSTGGVFIRTDWPFPVDTEIRLNIQLEDTGEALAVQGMVVSNNIDASFDTSVRGMGVRFMRVDPVVIEQISALYSEELTRDTKRLVRSKSPNRN